MHTNRKHQLHENQLELPLQFAPPKVIRHGLREAHPWPLVSQGKRRDGEFNSWRVPASEAWDFREIELRTGNSFPCLILDLDGMDASQRLYRLIHAEGFPLYSWGRVRQGAKSYAKGLPDAV